MPDINYLPISQLDESLLFPLMNEEREAWLEDLDWDYSIIQQILTSFMARKLLPGYAAFADKRRMIGYIYFLTGQSKGSIGALYTAKMDSAEDAQEVADGLLSLGVSGFKNIAFVRRIEAQIMPFHGQSYAGVFTQNGFRHYPRSYLTMNLEAGASDEKRAVPTRDIPQVIPFDTSRLNSAAKMTMQSYRGELDAEICSDYRTVETCANYLQSLVRSPGCGVFMPYASFMGLDPQGVPCGYVVCSRISEESAMIPQIVVRPDCRGLGLGNVLMDHCRRQLRAWHFHSLHLMVSEENSRARDWYQRLGFQTCRKFGAFVWERNQ